MDWDVVVARLITRCGYREAEAWEVDGDFAIFLMEQLDAEDSRVEFAMAQAACWPHAGDSGEQMLARYNRLLERSRATQWFVVEEDKDEDYYRSEWRSLFSVLSELPGVKVERHQDFIRK